MKHPSKSAQLAALAQAQLVLENQAKDAMRAACSLPSPLVGALKDAAKGYKKNAAVLAEIAELIGADLYSVEG